MPAPTIASVTTLASNKIRVTFSQPMKRDDALVSKFNYSILAFDAGAQPVFVNEVTENNAPNPTFVDLHLTEMTNGKIYKAHATGLTDAAFVPMVGTQIFNFVGLGNTPAIRQILAVGKNRVDVQFTAVMADESAIRTPGKYLFDNGLLTLSVVGVVGNTVQLATSNQDPNTLYTLTVNP